MRVSVAQAATAPHLPSQSSNYAIPASPSSLFTTLKFRLHRSQSHAVGSLSTHSSTPSNLRRSCSASFDGLDSTQKHNIPNKKLPPLVNRPLSRATSFKHLGSQVDVLEPSLLGIRPEPPEWPAREEVIRDCIARRASSIELPLSLRMIKLKHRIQKLEEERENGELGDSFDNRPPISNLCCSILHIFKEVQSQALKIRGLVLDEDLDAIVGKVQKEMTSSLLWLFREVYAKTPDLMLEVMSLTSNFAIHSLESYPGPGIPSSRLEVEEGLETNSRNLGFGDLEVGRSGVPTKEILEGMEDREMELWNSILEEANEMKGSQGMDEWIEFSSDVLREQKKVEFVSPVRVDIEGDEYEEYYSTNLLYQIGLSQDHNNPLLLSNYAQFLWLYSRDYDRSEECFKRAIQLDPSDAEIVSQYASFLWLARKDLWGAEERYQQAMAADPDNSFHTARYANFLWSTGSEDTCYPLDPPQP